MEHPEIPALHRERWVCALIPINNNYEDLLCNDIIPVANEILKEGRASNFIYRREGEDKLALYFRTNPVNSERYIKPLLIKQLKEENVDYRDFCILYFGNGNDANLAEILLPFTSKVISSLIKEAGKDWGIEVAIEKAIPLHLALVHAFEMSPKDISAFYDFVIKDALAKLPLEDVDHRKEWETKFVEMLDTNFQAQKEALVGYTEYLLSSFDNNDAFDEEWINGWRKTCLSASAILNLQSPEQRFIPEDFEIDDTIGVDVEIQKKWPLLHQFVRFINAQMGMELLFEFNLLYALQQCGTLSAESIELNEEGGMLKA